jgi:hypothetical protein
MRRVSALSVVKERLLAQWRWRTCRVSVRSVVKEQLFAQLRPPRCDTRVTPEEKRRFLARRAQETKQRRALFNAETDAETT